MPERSEVQIVVEQLQNNFSHQNLHKIEIVGGRYLKRGLDLSSIQFPLHNTSFNCRGKFIYWQFEEGKPIFFIHLGMSGSFGHQSKHSAIKFTFDDGKVIYFNDIRRFGTFKIVDDVEILREKLASLYWDILQEPIPHDIVQRVRKYPKKTIAEVLLNQKIYSGCGNYLKSESLYGAKIHPLRQIQSLNDEEILTICRSLVKIVKEAYAMGGATIQTFADFYGNVGKYQKRFKVYRKKLDPYGNKVIRDIAPDKRSIYYVKEVQK